MDFASIIDLKNPENIDWGHYPIQSGVWYTTRGSLEPREEKKSQSFPLPDATIIVILHKDHKVYYSDTGVIARNEAIQDFDTWILRNTQDDRAQYHPFALPPPLHRNTRKYVQDYFRDRYHLELSVRPVHKKWISEDGKPYAMVNAQIQVGDAGQFKEYSREKSKK